MRPMFKSQKVEAKTTKVEASLSSTIGKIFRGNPIRQIFHRKVAAYHKKKMESAAKQAAYHVGKLQKSDKNFAYHRAQANHYAGLAEHHHLENLTHTSKHVHLSGYDKKDVDKVADRVAKIGTAKLPVQKKPVAVKSAKPAAAPKPTPVAPAVKKVKPQRTATKTPAQNNAAANRPAWMNAPYKPNAPRPAAVKTRAVKRATVVKPAGVKPVRKTRGLKSSNHP